MSSLRSLIISDTTATLLNVMRHLPNLISLRVRSMDARFFIGSEYLDFPKLEILAIRVTIEYVTCWQVDFSTWKTPRLRHLFIGIISPATVHRVIAWLENSTIGQQLESFECDVGINHVPLGATLWRFCPNLRTLIVDLGLVDVDAPPEGEALLLRRLVHTGRLSIDSSNSSFSKWISKWASALPDFRVEFTRHSWKGAALHAGYDITAGLVSPEMDAWEYEREVQEMTREEYRRAMATGKRWKTRGKLLLDRDGQEFPDPFMNCAEDVV